MLRGRLFHIVGPYIGDVSGCEGSTGVESPFLSLVPIVSHCIFFGAHRIALCLYLAAIDSFKIYNFWSFYFRILPPNFQLVLLEIK